MTPERLRAIEAALAVVNTTISSSQATFGWVDPSWMVCIAGSNFWLLSESQLSDKLVSIGLINAEIMGLIDAEKWRLVEKAMMLA